MDNVQLARELYNAFNRGDVATVLGMMHPDIEWREAEGNPYQPSGEPWRGSDAIVQNLFVPIGTDFDGFTVHPHTLHDAGSTVIVEGRYTGTQKTTGKSLDAQVCHVLGFRDGQLVSFQQFVDTAQLQAVMGTKESAYSR